MKRIAVYCGASKGKDPFMLKKHTNLVNIWLSKAMN